MNIYKIKSFTFTIEFGLLIFLFCFLLVLSVKAKINNDLLFHEGENHSSESNSSSSDSGIFCLNGAVLCSSGLTPACPTNYNPTCLPGYPANVIDCCRNTGFALDCKSELPVCSNIISTSSSSSSSGLVISAFCSSGTVFCADGSIAACTDRSYTPKCLPGYPNPVIECCSDNKISLYCRSDLVLTCPIVSSTSKFQTINVDIISTPQLPSIVEPVLITDEFIGKIGVAYTGSNPSFEIKLPSGYSNIDVTSVDLKDSSGFIFNNISFLISEIPNQPDKLVLQLTLPDSIKEGESKFSLNLSDGDLLTGIIQVIKPLEVAVFKPNSDQIKLIAKPRISRFSVSKNNNKYSVTIKGENFAGRRLLLNEGETFNLIENAPNNPHTAVTLFPSSLKAIFNKISAGQKGETLKVKFTLPLGIETKTKASLIISTPRGQVSYIFTLKPKFSTKPQSLPQEVTGEPFCSDKKVTCTNGLKPVCTNSSYDLTCLPGFPARIPDCCKKDERKAQDCKSFLLKCR